MEQEELFHMRSSAENSSDAHSLAVTDDEWQSMERPQALVKRRLVEGQRRSEPELVAGGGGAKCGQKNVISSNQAHSAKNKKLFPQKLWDLINDDRYSFCLRWSDDGQLVYLNRDEFEESYLKKPENQFHTQKAISFVRQMNMYGFRKVDDSYYENDNFKRGCEHLLKRMVRKHPNKSTAVSQQLSPAPLNMTSAATNDGASDMSSLLLRAPETSGLTLKGGSSLLAINEPLAASTNFGGQPNVETDNHCTDQRLEIPFYQDPKEILKALIVLAFRYQFSQNTTSMDKF